MKTFSGYVASQRLNESLSGRKTIEEEIEEMSHLSILNPSLLEQRLNEDPIKWYPNTFRPIYDYTSEAYDKLDNDAIVSMNHLLKVPFSLRKYLVNMNIRKSLFRGIRIRPTLSLYKDIVEAIKKDKIVHIARHGQSYWYRMKVRYKPQKEFESWTSSEEVSYDFGGEMTAYQQEFPRLIRRIISGETHWMALKNNKIPGVVMEMDEIPMNNIVVSDPFIDKVSKIKNEKEYIIKFPRLASRMMYMWIPASSYFLIAHNEIYSRQDNGLEKMYHEMLKYFPNLPPLKEIDPIEFKMPEPYGPKDETAPRIIKGKRYFRHPNGGGLVAETAYAAPTAKIHRGVIVHDRCKILGNVELVAREYGGLQLYGNCIVDNAARIFCYGGANLKIVGSCQILDFSTIRAEGGNGIIKGNVKVSGNTAIKNETKTSHIRIISSKLTLHNSYVLFWGADDRIIGRVDTANPRTSITMTHPIIECDIKISANVDSVTFETCEIAGNTFEIAANSDYKHKTVSVQYVKAHAPHLRLVCSKNTPANIVAPSHFPRVNSQEYLDRLVRVVERMGN